MRKKISIFLVITFLLNFSGISVLATSPLPANATTDIVGSDDVRVIVNSIKDSVVAGETPGVGTLIYLDAIREKVAQQLVDVEAQYLDVRGSLTDIEQADADAAFDNGAVKTNNLLSNIASVIATPVQDITVEALNDILVMLDESDKETYGSNIIHAKPELSKTVVEEEKVFNPRAIKPTGAPVTEADLLETPEIQFTPRITELAAELGNDPVAMFTYVRNNVVPEMYYGSAKGAEGTLVDMAGSSVDISSLMISLFRVSGYPARYVYGDVKLKIDNLKNWVGVPEEGDPQAAIDILVKNGIPCETIYKQDVIEGAIFYHTWVEVKDGNVWRLVDPSYKHFVYTKSTELTTVQSDMLVALGDEMANATIISSDEKEIIADVSVFESAMEEATAIVGEEYAFGKRVIIVSEKNNLPPYLAQGIIGARKPAGEYAELPEDQRFKVRVSFPGTDADPYICNISDIDTKVVSLSYIMDESGCFFTDPDATIFDVTPLMTYMIPQVLIDHEVVYTRNQTVRLGTQFPFQTALLRPGHTVWEEQNRTEISGTSTDIYVCTQNTSLTYLAEKIDDYQALVETSGMLETDTMTQEMVSNQLSVTNRLYFAYMDMFREMISQEIGVVNVNHINVSFLTDDIKIIGFFGLVLKVAKGGITIDIIRSCNNPISIHNRPEDAIQWMHVCGGIGTTMESTILEIIYDSPSVSTGEILTESQRAGIPIVRVTCEADLAGVVANSVVKDHIRLFLNAETYYEALIPKSPVSIVNGDNMWTGSGWIITNPETGGSGYMICGGLHNNNIIANGGSLIDIVNNAISDAIHWLHLAEIGLELGIIPAAGMVAVICGLMKGAMMCMANTMASIAFAANFVAVFFIIIAVILAVVVLSTYTAWLKSLVNNWMGYILRKRNYMFA